MLKQVLLVLAFCAIATVRAQLPCLGAPQHLPHSFAAAAVSCDSYVICMGGDEIHGQRCPAGLLFEPVSQICGQSSCQECSPFGVQNLPHPDSCNQFIECIMGTRTFRTCPNNLMFDRTVGACNEPHLVYCPGEPITDDPHPTDPTYETAPTGETWPTEPWPTEPWPTEPPVTNPPNLPRCVPGGQVHHAHPTDCTRFFLCICVHTECTLWEQQCTNNFHWNQLVNVCDRPESAGCLNRPTDAPWPPGPPGEPTDPPLFPPPESDLWEEAEGVQVEETKTKLIVHRLNGDIEEIMQ